jgi:phenylalanyl-tRNA synthetase alpha chain
VVDVADNYDALGYPADGAARDARYTRYVAPSRILRTQTSAMLPPLLRALAPAPAREVLLACPGVVYRRDCIDRLHLAEPHQLDLWRLRPGPTLGEAELRQMVELTLGAALPGVELRTRPARHPYTEQGLELEARWGEAWVEVGECGLASPALLARCGLRGVSGLAMGLGLDRLLLLRKGLPDLRLLRAEDPRIAEQMRDLSPWREVAHTPPVRRDLSLAVDEGTTPEELGDHVREALGPEARWVEEVLVVAETHGAALPAQARDRLGLQEGQKNVLLRLTLRDPERSLTREEANHLAEAIYAALHQGLSGR